MKPLKGLTMAQTKKLMEHSKMHKGGMSSKHMKNMVKFMRSLKGIVTRANTYYSENRSNSNKDSNNLKQGYKNA